MSLSHSPKIVTSGLVFAYDMGNDKKSWKGAPTFNASLQNGQNDVSPWSGDGTPTSLGIDSSVKFRGRKVAKYQTGSSGNCYINGAGDLSTGTTSTVWTSTIYLKRVDGTPLTSVTMYQYITNNTNVNAAQTLTLVEDGWYKAVYTRSGLSAGYPSLTGMTGLGAGNQYYFADWQCENNLYSTPWVSGTRSNTQALLDLTGNHTLTSSSGVIYNSDGTFSFTTTANTSYFDLNSQNIISGTNPFTIEAWTNKTSGSYGEILGNFGSGYSTGLWFATAGLYIVGSVYHTDYANSMAGIHHSAATRDSSGNVKLYRDGVLVSTGTLTSSIPSNINFRIGADVNGGAESLGGNIYNVKVYNQVLTAAEVTQNFNALRGRYGI